jgi:ketosteroid isomerase-like protein
MSEALERYLATMQDPNASIDDTMAFFTERSRFRDPFNDVRGRAQIRRMFEKTHEDLDDIRIEVTDRAAGGDAHYIRWTFRAMPKGFLKRQGPFVIDGMTELHFDEAGHVTAHLDYWDPTPDVWQRIPVLGTIVKTIRARIGAG